VLHGLSSEIQHKEREKYVEPHLRHANDTGLTLALCSLTAVWAGAASGDQAMHYEHDKLGFAIATLIAWSLIFVGAGLFAIFA
jgi:hypothetical protein